MLQVIALIGVAACCGWSATRTGARAAQNDTQLLTSPTMEADDVALKQLVAKVLPVWAQHVESVKSQTEEAITQLVLRFASINRQFESAGFGGTHAASEQSDDATFGLLTLCERQLTPVVSSMTKMLDSKQTLVSSVNDLAAATRELGGMISDVAEIAAHTNILAINAAIEAAHAGDRGRGFSVIAKEIRALSQTSAESGKRIADRMAQVETIMKAAVETARSASVHDAAAIALSGSVIEDVLTHVRELGANADAMRAQGNVIRDDTEALLMSLQFQDRVSQILTVVDGDIRRLQDNVDAPQLALPPPEVWLNELGKHYTMDDQRKTADAQATSSGAKQAEPAEEVEFF